MTHGNSLPARRGSLVGPLIVLMLGVLFLISNLRPDLSAWRMFARYWPGLLIFWGAARIIEYLIARSSSQPIVRTLTGGEVFLIILICIAGAGLTTADRGDWRLGRFGPRSLEMFGVDYEFPVQAGRPVPPNAAITIVNAQGSLRVVGLDAPNLKVTGQKRIRAFDHAEAENTDQATPVEITEEAGRIYVRLNQRRPSDQIRVNSDLVVEIPKGSSLSVETRSGELEVKDIAGPVDVNSSSNAVRVVNIAKDVRVVQRRGDLTYVHLVKGNLDISGKGRDMDLQEIAGTVAIDGGFSGNIRLQGLAKPFRYTSPQTDLSFEKLPGRIEMSLGNLEGNDVVGPIRLTAQNKDVHLQEFTRDIEINTRRGDVSLRTSRVPLSSVRAESGAGNIRVDLPATARFSLQATTANGTAENDFGETIQTERRKNSASMQGGVSGGPQVWLSTKRGTIALGKTGQPPSL